VIVLRDIAYGVVIIVGLGAYLFLAFLISYAFSFRKAP
jgi:hypothetical protein